MASSRLTQAAYEAAKRAADLDGVSAVEFISQAVLKAARERIAREIAEVKGRGIKSEIASLKARHEALLAELQAYVDDDGAAEG
jgi:uncharacterized protein (DUF1778 family)